MRVCVSLSVCLRVTMALLISTLCFLVLALNNKPGDKACNACSGGVDDGRGLKEKQKR